MRLRVTELTEALRAAASIEASELDELRQRNLELQNIANQLLSIIARQSQALDVTAKHADMALKHNGSLKVLTERLHTNSSGRVVF